MKQKRLLLIFALLLLAFGMTASAGAAPAQQDEGTLWEVVQENEQLNTLETLIEAAGLINNLEEDGPFTIFAPTDSALADFDVDADGEGFNLTEIILYHVVNGNYDGDAVANQDSLTTLMGDQITISTSEGDLVLNDNVQIVESNVMADNGVIHLIDSVLIPMDGDTETDEDTEDEDSATDEDTTDEDVTQPTDEDDEETDDGATMPADADTETMSLANFLESDGRFDTLYGLLVQNDLLSVLGARDDFTLFAPTDAAFEKLSTEQIEEFMERPDLLEIVLLNHVVGDSLSADQIATDEFIPTLADRGLTVNFDEGVATVSGANFVNVDTMLQNGTVHAIDKVLIP